MSNDLTTIMEPVNALTTQLTGALREQAQVTAGLSALWAQMDLRISALEHEVSGRTILHADVMMLHGRIRERVAGESAKHQLIPKAESVLRAEIRKAVLKRYGIKDLHDLPAAKLDEAAGYIDTMPIIRLVIKAREKANASV